MSTSADLETLQRWMQAVVTHPDGIIAGIDSPSAREQIDVASADIERVIRRSQALTSIERLQIYGSAYYARLIDCLAAEFPATQHAVGEDAFSGFVFGYLQQYPSTSYTLGELGASFPRYLAESRPPREQDGPDWADFLVDLSLLERTYSEVFDGPGEEQLAPLTADALRAIPAEAWADACLETAASLRLLQFRFPVHGYASAVREKKQAMIPTPQPTHLAINRRNFIVRRRALEPLPCDLLRRLQQGISLGRAIEESTNAHGPPAVDFATRLQEWFRAWTADGYFTGVTMAGPESATG